MKIVFNIFNRTFFFFLLFSSDRMLLNFLFLLSWKIDRRFSLTLNFLTRLTFLFATTADEHWRKTECRGGAVKNKFNLLLMMMHEKRKVCGWWVRKTAPIFSHFHFAFFWSTVNKSYTSSSLLLLFLFCGAFFSSFGFIVFPPLMFTKCIDREKKPQYYALWSKTINLFKHSLSV